jgi:hypothetical protein
MNSSLTGNWNKKKEKLKQKYQILNDKDLWYSQGKENEMIEMLSHKLGMTRKEVLGIIVEL